MYNEEKINYISIEVPDENDSMSSITLNDTEYYIRFTYNDRGDFWKFSLYDSDENPLLIGIKIVPQFPLGMFSGMSALPDGIFAVYSNLEHIGRYDFVNKKADFIFYSTYEDDEAEENDIDYDE